MSTTTDRLLADRAPWVYAAGLLAIVGARAASLPRFVQSAVVVLALCVMIVTFAVERLGDGGVAHPLSVGVGAAGVAAGGTLALAGRPAGLVFLAGGLAFLHRGLAGGERQ